MKFILSLLIVPLLLLASCGRNKSLCHVLEIPKPKDTLVHIKQLPDFTTAYILKKDSTKSKKVLMHYIPYPDDEDSLQLEFQGQGESFRTMLLPAAASGYCDSEHFDGSYRKQVKTSRSTAGIQTYTTLSKMMTTLPADAVMRNEIVPPIGTNSARVNQEERNVKIKSAYLCCFSKQKDEDFHLIISTSKNWNTAKFFNVEISGLPAAGSADYAVLNQVRQHWMYMIDENSICSGGYYWYDTPERITISGSLFFDKQHASTGVGPQGAQPKTAWEIHPITVIDWY